MIAALRGRRDARASSTCAPSTPTPSRAMRDAIAARPRRAAGSATDVLGSGRPSTSRCGSAPARTSAARRPRCSRASRASAAIVRGQAAAAGRRGPVRPADGRQQRAHARGGAGDPRRRAGRPTRHSGVGRSRGTQVFQLGGNVARGGIVETAVRRHAPRARRRLRRRHARRAARCARCRSAGRSARTCPPTASTSPLDYEAFAADGRCSATAASSSSTTPSTWRAQARFAMEFCAEESCGKCTPCRIGVGARRRGDRPDRRGRRPRRRTSRCSTTSASVMVDGSLCAMGGLTPLPVRSALRHFAEDFGEPGGTVEPCRHAMSPIIGTTSAPPVSGAPTVDVDDRRAPRRGAGRARRSCAPPPPRASTSRSCAPPTRSSRSARAGCASSRSRAAGHARVVHHAGRAGHDGAHRRPRALERLRRGVMELYISDHPLDCLTCPANGDCELQDMAGVVGLREVRYGFDGDEPPRRAPPTTATRTSRSTPQVHRLLALRARVRRDAGDVRADASRAAASTRRSRASAGETFIDSRVRLVRRVRAGVPDRDAAGEVGHRARQPDARASRRPARTAASAARSRAEMKGDEVVRMVPDKDGGANDGHSCVKGRFAWGYATHRDRVTPPMIRDRSTIRGARSRWDEAIALRRRRGSSAIQARVRRRRDRRHHVVALHQRGDVRRPEDGARRVRQQQRRHLRARLPLADRATGSSRRSATSAGTQDFDSVDHADVILRDRREPDRRASRCSRRG